MKKKIKDRIKRVISTRAIIFEIARSDLFDTVWYLKENPDVAAAGMHPIIHYVHFGASEGREPHPYFDSNWYLKTNLDVKVTKINPFYHYIKFGRKESRQPNSNQIILSKRKSKKSIFLSFIFNQLNEKRSSYRLKHRLTNAVKKHLTPSQEKGSIQFSLERDLDLIKKTETNDVRLIAMYLPQYHKIKENSKWWGEGFTEWTNVKRGKPFYEHHYQPHTPHPDIGYYDLDNEAVLEKQTNLAREYGIYGFCYYYYWFNGKRLLERPIDNLLESKKPDFPFCFCWANENWTRTWDGGDNEILIGQEHSYENDELFIKDIIPALKDPRYIKINGKPLIVIYRPALLPNMKATADHWREVCRKEGIGEIYLAGMRSFEFIDPLKNGLDAAIQFPPANVPAHNLASNLKLKANKGFKGHVYDMSEMVDYYSGEEAKFPLMRSVCPSWDNTARRMERGTSWINATTQVYFNWLAQAIEKTRKTLRKEERLIFINAWNEWGEGCHLEPCSKYGYSFLNATKSALQACDKKKKGSNILVVSHDAALAGAQVLTLNLLREWKRSKATKFKVILIRHGELRNNFEALGDTLVLEDYKDIEKQEVALKAFLTEDITGVYSSTVVNGLFLKKLRFLKVPIITHAHELQKSIERWAPGKIIEETIRSSDLILGGAPQVIENLQKRHSLSLEKSDYAPDFIECWGVDQIPSEREKKALRKSLGLAPHEIVVFGCGTTDWRKGPDLFLETAIKACEKKKQLKFIWIGGDPSPYMQIVKQASLEKNILFLGTQQQSRRYYYVGNIFFLSSREDPSPLVALEAADAGLPLVCFAKAGDIPFFVKSEAGCVVPLEDVDAAAKAIISLAENENLRISLGRVAKQKVQHTRNSTIAASNIIEFFEHLKTKV